MSCLLSSTDVPLMITQIMPAYHRVRGHILAAQIRQQQQQGGNPLSPLVSDDGDDPLRLLQRAPQIPIRTKQNASLKSTYMPPSVELSMHLSISSFDLALTTAEQLLSRANLVDLSMDLSPAAPEVRSNVHQEI